LEGDREMYQSIKERATDKKWTIKRERCSVQFNKDIKQIKIRAEFGCYRDDIERVLQDSCINYPYFKEWQIMIRAYLNSFISILVQLYIMEVRI
jgi:hypothetical protein